jgi:hypothetical protein
VSDVYGLADILKTNGYVVASESCEEQPAVMNGARYQLAGILGGSGVHARTTIAVQSL